ncbi:MAG: M48 family metallopeptidase [Candidatus Anstonellales archaeon]
MERKSFYEQITQNKIKSYLLLGVILLLVFASCWLIASLLMPRSGPILIVFALVLSILYSFGGYYYSDKIILAATGARKVEKSEYPHLFHTVEGLAIAAGIPTPQIYIMDSPSPNAFATGKDPEHGIIVVTRGLIELMNREEIEGVLAHEISHIQNYDIRFATLAVVLVGLLSIISNFFLRAYYPFGERSRGRGGRFEIMLLFVAILFIILAPIIARLVSLAISRKREFLADASAAKLTRNPLGLASALEKLRKTKQPLDVPESAAPLFIVNPFGGKFANLFSTHPPIEERIKALKAM